MSLKNTILSVTRRTKKGFTVGEIWDRVSQRLGTFVPYSSVRARVAELAATGTLVSTGTRKDRVSGTTANAFRRA